MMLSQWKAYPRPHTTKTMNLTQILGRRTSFSNCQDELCPCYTKSTFGGNLGFVDTEELLSFFRSLFFLSLPFTAASVGCSFSLFLFLSAFHLSLSRTPPFPPYLLSAGVIISCSCIPSLSYFFIASISS